MTERIIAYSLDVRPTVLTDVSRRLIAGGIETKYHITGNDIVKGQGASYVERVFDPNIIQNRDIIKKWKDLKQAGIDVAPELLVNPMKGTMFFTDIKADGSEVYGKGLETCLTFSNVMERDRPRPEIDTHFLTLTSPQQIAKIEHEARKVVHKANAHSIELPEDDPMELIIHPDGTWGFITLDLAYANTDTPRSLLEKRLRDARNTLHCDKLLRDLRSIRELLISPGPYF